MNILNLPEFEVIDTIQDEHDKRKRNYAKEHNINLLEIWYYDIDNIEDILLERLQIKNN